MKKLFICCIFILIITGIFAGCSTKQDQSFDTDNWQKDLVKSQKIVAEKLNGDSSSITMTEEEEIQKFIDRLEIDTWEQTTTPRKAEKETRYILYQEATKHLGEGKSDKTNFKEIAQIIIYKDTPYIDMQIKDWTISFKVPERVVKSLGNFN